MSFFVHFIKTSMLGILLECVLRKVLKKKKGSSKFHLLLDDPLMFYENLVRFLHYEDIIKLYLISKRMNALLMDLDEIIRADMSFDNLGEDYGKYLKKIDTLISLGRNCRFGWKRFSVNCEYGKPYFTERIISDPLKGIRVKFFRDVLANGNFLGIKFIICLE